MDSTKNRGDTVELLLVSHLLEDAQASHGGFNTRQLRGSQQWLTRRYRDEGLGLLTKTLPSFGKHLDQVLAGNCTLKACNFSIPIERGTKIPRFLGSLFRRIIAEDGTVLPDPDANCVRTIRNILYCFYKYEVPYSQTLNEQVISSFIKTEDDLLDSDALNVLRRQMLPTLFAARSLSIKLASRPIRQQPGEGAASVLVNTSCSPSGDSDLHSTQTYQNNSLWYDNLITTCSVARKARRLLFRLLNMFDPRAIVPSHGPGAVSTGEKLWEKFEFTNVPEKICHLWPLDEYFYASQSHVADALDELFSTKSDIRSAKVILVPKDSRGPRLISCEPLEFQWIQQGLRRELYRLIEGHPLTKWNVFFTNQQPNQLGALLGSKYGNYATLDLKEASDRVSVELVRLIFPEWFIPWLEGCRSESTRLPNGELLKLRKFAPMGSALCFPIMALTIWALLTSHAPDADTRDRILVYGDDVIVPTAYAERAITILEEFGLKINLSKSCYQKGPFRESCGMDAFKGVPVTPVRIRTVWSESPSASHYCSWIAYANQYYSRGLRSTYQFLVSRLQAIYGPIPDKSMGLTVPSLEWTPNAPSAFRTRTNRSLQKREFRVWDLKQERVVKEINGWKMLLRFFTETFASVSNGRPPEATRINQVLLKDAPAFSASSYTPRGRVKLVRRWR